MHFLESFILPYALLCCAQTGVAFVLKCSGAERAKAAEVWASTGANCYVLDDTICSYLASLALSLETLEEFPF